MSASPHTDQPNAHARWSMIQAVWPLVILADLVVAAIFLGTSPALAGLLRVFLLALAVAGSLAVLVYSVILVFDALLFRVIASYDDEWKGAVAVDDILARMRLKPIPATTRSLADRVAGTRRLATRQRVALAAASAAMLILTVPNYFA